MKFWHKITFTHFTEHSCRISDLASHGTFSPNLPLVLVDDVIELTCADGYVIQDTNNNSMTSTCTASNAFDPPIGQCVLQGTEKTSQLGHCFLENSNFSQITGIALK